MPTPTAPLRDQMIYEAWDRFVCNRRHCSGATIHATGRTATGHPVHPVTTAFLLEWSRYATGPLTCQCGRLIAALDPAGEMQILDPATL